MTRRLFAFILPVMTLSLVWPALAIEPPVMKRIEPGTYKIGTETGEPDERPVSVAKIENSFALARVEVTRAEYSEFVRTTARTSQGGCHIYVEGKLTSDAQASWEKPHFEQSEKDPVVCVSWEDAAAFASWLSAQTGRHFRLPTEAEWEYVARKNGPGETFWSASVEACRVANGTDETALSASGGVLVTGDPARYKAREEYVFPCQDKAVYTAPVGSYAPDRSGIYDLLGNVWEYTQDCVNDNYTHGPTTQAAVIEGDCSRRIIRGGAWNTGPLYVRIGNRSALKQQDRNWAIGFRLAEDIRN